MAEGFAVSQSEHDDSAEQKTRFPHQHADSWAWAIVVAVAVVWWIAWQALEPLAYWLTYDLLGLAHGSQLGESVAFFVYVGYMAVVSVTFFLITGALGFISCFIFVRQIYSAIKID